MLRDIGVGDGLLIKGRWWEKGVECGSGCGEVMMGKGQERGWFGRLFLVVVRVRRGSAVEVVRSCRDEGVFDMSEEQLLATTLTQ